MEGLHIETMVWNSFKTGSKQAYGVIFAMYYPKLYNYGRKFTGDTYLVEDCIQEIFTAFWQNRHKMKDVKVLGSYLFVSFRHALLKAMQKNKSETRAGIDKEAYDFNLELSVDQLMINMERLYEQRIHLHKALELLTARQKEAVFLKFYEDLSYEEISQILGISQRASYKLVARAIIELRKIHQQKLSYLFSSITAFIVCAQALM